MNTNTTARAAKNQRKTWAVFQKNTLEEITEPTAEQQNEDGSTTLTKTFVVVKQDRYAGPRVEEEFDDLRQAYQCFAEANFLDFMHEVEMGFDAHDTVGDPYDFEFPALLNPLRKLAKALAD